MRFFAFLSTCALLSSAIAGSLPTRTRRQPQSARQNHALVSRQNIPIGPVDLTLCATINATLPISVNLPSVVVLGIPLGGQSLINLNQTLCVCAAAGVLTDDSVARVRADLLSQTGLIASLLSVLDINLVLEPVLSALLTILGDRQDDAGACPAYPEGAIPQCSSCDFECEAPLVRCGDTCAASCPSSAAGGGTRRRRQMTNPDLLCPTGLTACAASFKVVGAFGRIECMDVRTSIETCGGCEFPLPGRSRGEDCSAINGADVVTCEKGKCVVHACQDGFELVANKLCVPTKA